MIVYNSKLYQDTVYCKFTNFVNLEAFTSFFLHFLFQPEFLNQALCAPGFLKLIWFARRYVCVCVRPEGINNQWHDICFMAFNDTCRL